jgi:hypothetical protein
LGDARVVLHDCIGACEEQTFLAVVALAHQVRRPTLPPVECEDLVVTIRVADVMPS